MARPGASSLASAVAFVHPCRRPRPQMRLHSPASAARATTRQPAATRTSASLHVQVLLHGYVYAMFTAKHSQVALTAAQLHLLPCLPWTLGQSVHAIMTAGSAPDRLGNFTFGSGSVRRASDGRCHFTITTGNTQPGPDAVPLAQEVSFPLSNSLPLRC
jgi:hypothetical protein